MLKEIYFRDPLDNKYRDNILEVSDALEALIAKLRMILLTNKGEVLGEPYFGMDLEKYLFEERINTNTIRTDFYAQLAKYVPESTKFQIDCEVRRAYDEPSDKLYLDVTINNIPYLGFEL